MDRNLSRLLWEGFLMEWFIMPWSEAKILPCSKSPCLSLQESGPALEPQPSRDVLNRTVI